MIGSPEATSRAGLPCRVGAEHKERDMTDAQAARTADTTTPLLAGKVAIITGASRGIGATTARAFAASGASVVLAARDETSLRTAADEIASAGGRALAVPTDVTNPRSVERLVGRTLEAFGRLDAALNNAADGYPPTPLGDVGDEDFDRVVAVNLRGVFSCMKHEI